MYYVINSQNMSTMRKIKNAIIKRYADNLSHIRCLQYRQDQRFGQNPLIESTDLRKALKRYICMI